MAPPPAPERPLLSICIPTYNRAACLEKLLGCLERITATHGPEVQVCVSNNQSPDGTAQVIEAWRQRFEFDAVTQPTNIGATRNVAEVVRLATGRWILVMGDDDLLNPDGVSRLLSLLHSAHEGEWILASVGGEAGGDVRLSGLRAGRYDVSSARWMLLRAGLSLPGFIGMNVFPAARRSQLLGLSAEDAQPWPHVALLLRHLADGGITIFPVTVVEQAAAGKELFWSQGDWMRINLRMLDIAAAALREVKRHRGFYYGLIIRELFAGDSLKGVVYWRMFEPSDFRAQAVSAYLSRYRLLGPLAVVALAHGAFLTAVALTPLAVFRWIERVRGRGDTVARYLEQKDLGRRFDGMQRGL